MARRTIQATVQSVAVEQGNKGDYLTIKVKQPKLEFPETYKVWDPIYKSHYESLRGYATTLTLERGKLKPSATDDGEIKSYYWELVTPQNQPLGQASELPFGDEAQPVFEDAPLPQPKSNGRSQPPPDPTRISIERQKAMDIASHLASLPNAAETPSDTWEITKMFFLKIMAAFHLPEERMLEEIKKMDQPKTEA